jgi:hypothetical protein
MAKLNPTRDAALKKLQAIKSRVQPNGRASKVEQSSNVEKTLATAYKGVRIVDNVEENALQIFFKGIPSETARKFLKKNDFVWAPIEKCWKRVRSRDAMYLAEKAIDRDER